ncbi:asparagine synthase (glutamine-hydrolyzing), partial [Candidatus Pseudothioglobus singularis]|nr:asparagine synthase (glutamine-hydrolyzing) [Candidatus Pseudothioglobus singularis]
GLNLNSCISRMSDAMSSRGPDYYGNWLSDDGILAFGHRRLSIIDIDERSNQPMHSNDHRYVIVFNGEIYNYLTLRKELQGNGYEFKTKSDTEVILALYSFEGDKMLSKLKGMFSIAIWDNLLESLFLARDSYGIKPLYIASSKFGWLFASQVKALLASEIVSKEKDIEGQKSFWLLGSVAEPFTWFKDISSLPAGSWLKIKPDQKFDGPHKFCDIGDCWRSKRILGSKKDIKAKVRFDLLESIKRHLVADVPIAVFLSGGIDSAALAALMLESGIDNLIGVTVTYDEFKGKLDDEAPAAKIIAKHYGIKHHIKRVTKNEFLQDLPLILKDMDQPTIDGINTWYASKAVSELGIKVVVSGVGGDELFLGYNSFKQLPKLVNMMRGIYKIPGGKNIANKVADLQAIRKSNPRWRYAPTWLQNLSLAWLLRRSIYTPDELSGLIDGLNNDLSKDFIVEDWLGERVGQLSDAPELQLAQIESMVYLRNQLLRDSDWASMSHSIELRTPLVDSKLLKNLAPLMPLFKNFPKKSLLSNSPAKSLPNSIKKKKKTGFSIPVEQWLFDEGLIKEKGSRSLAQFFASSYDSNIL